MEWTHFTAVQALQFTKVVIDYSFQQTLNDEKLEEDDNEVVFEDDENGQGASEEAGVKGDERIIKQQISSLKYFVYNFDGRWSWLQNTLISALPSGIEVIQVYCTYTGIHILDTGTIHNT